MADESSLWGPGYVPQDIPGPQGPAGPANNLVIGTVTQGVTPAATLTGTSPNQILNLTLPKGDQGVQGLPGGGSNLAIGSVTQGASGTPAAASITGTPPTQLLNLTLPAGPKGDPGTSVGVVDVQNSGTAGTNLVVGVTAQVALIRKLAVTQGLELSINDVSPDTQVVIGLAAGIQTITPLDGAATLADVITAFNNLISLLQTQQP